jgi:hypothetical protein
LGLQLHKESHSVAATQNCSYPKLYDAQKKQFSEDEIPLFDNAVLYKRGEFWQMRMWLPNEHKYARFSQKTRSKSTAIDKAESHYYELKVMEKQGKSYFSITTKMGVEMFLNTKRKQLAHTLSLADTKQSVHI